MIVLFCFSYLKCIYELLDFVVKDIYWRGRTTISSAFLITNCIKMASLKQQEIRCRIDSRWNQRKFLWLGRNGERTKYRWNRWILLRNCCTSHGIQVKICLRWLHQTTGICLKEVKLGCVLFSDFMSKPNIDSFQNYFLLMILNMQLKFDGSLFLLIFQVSNRNWKRWRCAVTPWWASDGLLITWSLMMSAEAMLLPCLQVFFSSKVK